METDQPAGQGKPEGTGDKEQQEPAPMPPVIRSYECTFCKRGFTNAQALGGHMNIHRKDKAKSKHSSSSSSAAPVVNDHTFASSHLPMINPFSVTTNVSPPQTRPFLDHHHHHHHEYYLKPELPLFGTTHEPDVHDQDKESKEIGMISDEGVNEQELDLELRLGHEPSSDSSKGTTRKFF